MSSELAMTYVCWACRELSIGCPDCVVSVLVDPETELPPDIARVNGKAETVTPTPEAVARALPQPICDDCVMLRNVIHSRATQWRTGADRHRTHLADVTT